MEKTCEEAGAALTKAAYLVENSSWQDSATEYGRAAALLEKAMSHALCRQASALSQLDRHVDALEAATRAARVSPKSAEPLYWQALSHERMNAHDAAAKAYRAASAAESDLSRRMLYSDAATRCKTVSADARAAREAATAAEAEKLRSARTEAAASAAAREKAATPITPAAAATAVGATGAKIDWYQSAIWVNVDVMAKGVDVASSEVVIEKRGIRMRLVRQGLPDWILEKTLFAEIDPAASRWSASKYKVELHLRKVGGKKWAALDAEAEVASASVMASALAAQRMKDTDEKQKKWNEKADEELKDYKEDDSAMAVFRQLYQSVDEDTRRAMNKSYSESGGQVLSTDWGKVQKEKVTYKPVGERDD